MERKVIRKTDYQPSSGIRSVGVSCTVPRLSLSVSELVKRFTLTTLKEMEARSLLNYDFGPEVNEDPFELLERMDLKVANCIDITDIEQLKSEALSQLEEYKAIKKESEALVAAEAAAKKEQSDKLAFAQRAAEYVRTNGIKIE